VRYLALVTDFDGVVARQGRPGNAALAAIERLRMSGRRAILNTGRRLSDVRESCPNLLMFDYIVAENGAVAYNPRTREETLLAEPPPAEFIARLEQLGVDPLEVGRVIVSTWQPHQNRVLQAIHEIGLELHVMFNRAAVMVLPSGVNKATGMSYALRRLGLSPHEVVGIGDSENDHSFLKRSECAVTVANAVASIRNRADWVTTGEYEAGLIELIDELIASDLSELRGTVHRHLVALGKRGDGSIATVPPFGHNILIAGPSGSGKSTVTAGIVERLMQQQYQVCIIDPEGDYGALQGVITLGSHQHAVTVNEVLSILEDPQVTLNVNLLGIPLLDRPEFFGQLFPSLQAMRTRTGRPHWIVLDEAHHMLPTEWSHLGRALPLDLGETILVTVHPDHLPAAILSLVDTVIAVGPSPDRIMRTYVDVVGDTLVWPDGLKYQRDQAVVWFPHESGEPFSVQILRGRSERIRHHRKYAEGNMRQRSFFFRGPGNRHNLRAHNLALFSLLADGIDEETWMFHLRRGDYSRWFRSSVKDNYLAEQAERIEKRTDLEPAETRELVRRLIESRYTLPE
jgi:HAD superfamily hydrolase (TIGR01484 family)